VSFSLFEQRLGDVDSLLRKSLRSSVESLVKPHPSIRGKSVPLLGMLSFFLFEQLFSGVVLLAVTPIMIVYETSQIGVGKNIYLFSNTEIIIWFCMFYLTKFCYLMDARISMNIMIGVLLQIAGSM
jgi:hypothetical protein